MNRLRLRVNVIAVVVAAVRAVLCGLTNRIPREFALGCSRVLLLTM